MFGRRDDNIIHSRSRENSRTTSLSVQKTWKIYTQLNCLSTRASRTLSTQKRERREGGTRTIYTINIKTYWARQQPQPPKTPKWTRVQICIVCCFGVAAVSSTQQPIICVLINISFKARTAAAAGKKKFTIHLNNALQQRCESFKNGMQTSSSLSLSLEEQHFEWKKLKSSYNSAPTARAGKSAPPSCYQTVFITRRESTIVEIYEIACAPGGRTRSHRTCNKTHTKKRAFCFVRDRNESSRVLLCVAQHTFAGENKREEEKVMSDEENYAFSISKHTASQWACCCRLGEKLCCPFFSLLYAFICAC